MEIQNQIKINDKTYDVLGNIMSDYKYMRGCRRDVIRLDFNLKEDEFNKIGIKDNVIWSIIENTMSEDGKIESKSYDKSTYSLICDKIIHYDGLVSIYLGKPTDMEVMESKYKKMKDKIMELNKKGILKDKDIKDL